MMISAYRKAYAALGEERAKERVVFSSSTNTTKNTTARKKGVMDLSENDQYWLLRRDRSWMDIPGSMRRIRGKRVFIEGVTKILLQLEPNSFFDPVSLWKAEKEKDNQTAAASATAFHRLDESIEKDTAGGNEASKTRFDIELFLLGPRVESPQDTQSSNLRPRALNSTEAAKLKTARENALKDLEREIILIRNSKDTLMNLVNTLKFNKSRLVLLVQMLQNAMDKNNQRDIFDIVWGINELAKKLTGDVQITTMPKNTSVLLSKVKNGSSLVFDSHDAVKTLIRNAKALLLNHRNIIAFQLTEMSDCLPPLSKFHFGFKLDEWQKKALYWIDQNESVIICAPTSSGKTVLSSYVAVIFKSTTTQESTATSSTDKHSSKRQAGMNEKKAQTASTPIEPKPQINMEAEGESDDGDGEDEEDFELPSVHGDDDSFEEDPSHLYQERLEEQIDNIQLADDTEGILLSLLAHTDAVKRRKFYETKKTCGPDVEFTSNTGQKVLFVVPTEPLVWQVAAYFSKLLRSKGDSSSTVALVTDALTFSPATKLGVMPQIVVGTPQALESALTKPRGLFGRFENAKRAAGDILAGGFDHFDWVIYDEVHALDGDEGAALQRLIRSMNCPFLALSATVGNAETLRNWFQQVRKDQQQHSPIHTVDANSGNSVQLIAENARFLNLQRFVWDPIHNTEGGTKLQMINPLAAVSSVEAMQQGLLSSSSISFTPQDSYQIWLDMKNYFPESAIARFDPNQFFNAQERITLPRTKLYEDLLKEGLQSLAQSHPIECRHFLEHYKIEDGRAHVDLCELALDLKDKDMLPAVAFHLNTFDAIKIFQQVLAGLEYRQKVAHPTYYTSEEKTVDASNKKQQEKIKSVGKNEKALLEQKKQGEIQELVSVDTSAPHPDFCLSKGIAVKANELDAILEGMERTDGFEKHKTQTQFGKKKPRNEVIMKHSLIRGLRRGIGLFIDEVSFPSYRRAVQKLASTGKLSLVISDGSLAFGVNMPFRTCIFCGEMRGELDELMSNQMSGRAGRRGLDTKGNIIYAGMRKEVITRLMVGKIRNITGEQHPPDYESLILQSILSPRHVGMSRCLAIAGISLNEFVNLNIHQQPPSALQKLFCSKQFMEQLGFITFNPTRQQLVPSGKSNYGLLCMIWELRHYPEEAIALAMLMKPLLEEFSSDIARLRVLEKSLNKELMATKMHDFFSIILQLVCRTPWTPATFVDGSQLLPLHELPYFTNGAAADRVQLLDKWANLFASQQAKIPAEFSHLRNSVPPGTPLDSTLFQCSMDRSFIKNLNEKQKQDVKRQIWHVGIVLKTMNNSLIIEDEYTRIAYFIIRDAFEKLRYLNSELIQDFVNFMDVSSYDLEKRTDDKELAMDKPDEAALWSGYHEEDNSV